MIPYVEIKDKYTLKTLALVEPQECWFELSYQNVGEFEVYCRASKVNLAALQKGRYIKLPNKRFIWVITSIQYTFTVNGARMILAKGYEAKWLLKKRCILTPIAIDGTITSATYSLVNNAMGTSASAARKIEGFVTATNTLQINIKARQTPRGNLLEYTRSMLKAYNCGDIVEFENESLIYKVFTGADKTQKVRFCQSLDNLLTSEYLTDDSEIATSALVVSTVDEVDYTQTYETEASGIDRAEIIIASNLSTKYEDKDGTEQETTPDSELYKGWQIEEGKTELAKHITIEEISGEIDLANSRFEFDKDFFIGDMVKVQDEYFSFYVDTQITKYTIKQDANGYGEEAEYGKEVENE